MRSKNKYQKTKKWFVTGLVSIVGSGLYAQSPTDTLTYYDLETALKANKDTIYAIEITKQRLDSVPHSLQSFPQLRGLRLTKNRLTDLPDFIKSLNQLNYLYLNKNRLTFMPSEIFYLDKLIVLDVSRNDITSIPKGIQNLQHLEYLDAWDNSFTFVDPALSSLEKIKYIDFRGMTFSPTFVNKWNNLLPNTQIEFDPPCDCLE